MEQAELINTYSCNIYTKMTIRLNHSETGEEFSYYPHRNEKYTLVLATQGL